MAKKFIINDGNLILGDVEYHSELSKNNSKTIGGGHWRIDHDEEILYLYGKSIEFGPVSEKEIELSNKPDSIYGYAIKYCGLITLLNF